MTPDTFNQDSPLETPKSKGRLQQLKTRLWRTGAALLTASVGLMSLAAPTYAATATLYASGMGTPTGTVWMGSHLWVSDHVLGLCRIDATATGASLNSGTCNLAATAAAAVTYDPAANFVYLVDGSAKSQGVWRLVFNPTTETVGKATLMAPGKGLAGNRPSGVAVGPDHELYVSFLKSGNIVKVTNSTGANTSQQVVTIGGTTDGRPTKGGLAFMGADLYVAESKKVAVIENAPACTGGCFGSPISIPPTDVIAGLSPSAIASDGKDGIYVADTPFTNSTIIKYSVSAATASVLASSGTLPGGGTQSFQGVAALAADLAANVYVGDGPPDSLNGGLIWLIGAGAAGGTGGTGGTTTPAALTASALYAAGLTAPAGQISMGTHVWVSDHVKGFCRLDGPAPDGTFAINGATCNTSAIFPGQAAYDPATNFVYLPDGSGASQGVWRLTFNPTAETVSNPIVIAPGKGLGGNLPTAVALGPDGLLYVSFSKNGNIVRVTTPAGGSQTVQSMGGSLSGQPVKHIAFVNSDLYLVEPTAVTRIGNATSVFCTGGCKAVATGIKASTPSAIASNGTDVLYIANGGDVLRYTVSTNSRVLYTNSGTLPNGTSSTFKSISGLMVDASGLYIGDDPSAGLQSGLGHVWKTPLVP